MDYVFFRKIIVDFVCINQKHKSLRTIKEKFKIGYYYLHTYSSSITGQVSERVFFTLLISLFKLSVFYQSISFLPTAIYHICFFCSASFIVPSSNRCYLTACKAVTAIFLEIVICQYVQF